MKTITYFMLVLFMLVFTPLPALANDIDVQAAQGPQSRFWTLWEPTMAIPSEPLASQPAPDS